VTKLRGVGLLDPYDKKIMNKWHLELPVDSMVMQRTFHGEEDRAVLPPNYEMFLDFRPEYCLTASPVQVNYYMQRRFAHEVVPLLELCPIKYPYSFRKMIDFCLDNWHIGGLNVTPDIESNDRTHADIREDRLINVWTMCSQQKMYNYWGSNLEHSDYLYFAAIMVKHVPYYRFSPQETVYSDPLPKIGNLTINKVAIDALNSTGEFPNVDRNIGNPGAGPITQDVVDAAKKLKRLFADDHFMLSTWKPEKKIFQSGWYVPQLVAISSSHKISQIHYTVDNDVYSAPVKYVGQCTGCKTGSGLFNIYNKREPNIVHIVDNCSSGSKIDINVSIV